MRAFFGPGGNCDAFRLAGLKSTIDAPRFVRGYGLTAYEYEAGQGIGASAATLMAIGEAAKREGIRLSLHAPYFISLSGVVPEKRLNSIKYIKDSLDAAHLLGAKTIVVHAGSAAKISRSEAMTLAADTLFKTLDTVDTYGIQIGIETMGKVNQLGTLDEVISLWSLDPSLVPVVDFGHLNARECGGAFNSAEDYYNVFYKIGDKLGDDVARNLHCHFSMIEWTGAGEKRHLTFDDEIYGPRYEPLCQTIADNKFCPTIICESAGTQTRDAKRMMAAYESLL